MATKPKSLLPKVPSCSPKSLIRWLAPTDIQVVSEILLEAEGAAAWSAKTIAEMLAAHGTLALVSERTGIIAGFLFARQVAEEAELLNIAVRKNLRRKGEGSKLLLAAVEELHSNGVQRIFLEVRESNGNAIAFYRKHGFSESGRRKAYYRDPLEDALCMEKKLTG